MADNLRTVGPRLKSQGRWALIVGTLGLLACVIGAVEFYIYGVLSIRPGHEPESGNAAIQMLVFLGLLSMLFIILGNVILYRARRNSV